MSSHSSSQCEDTCKFPKGGCIQNLYPAVHWRVLQHTDTFSSWPMRKERRPAEFVSIRWSPLDVKYTTSNIRRPDEASLLKVSAALFGKTLIGKWADFTSERRPFLRVSITNSGPGQQVASRDRKTSNLIGTFLYFTLRRKLLSFPVSLYARGP